MTKHTADKIVRIRRSGSDDILVMPESAIKNVQNVTSRTDIIIHELFVKLFAIQVSRQHVIEL